MLIVTEFFPAFVLPLHADKQNRANCFSGTDWEIHMAFGICIAIQSLGWTQWLEEKFKEKAAHWRIYACMLWLTAMVDMYMDANFIIVAKVCGSDWHVTLSSWTYGIGVLVLQYAFGIIGFVCVTKLNIRTFWWMVFLYPSDQLEDETGHMAPIVMCLLRSVGEDLVQAGIQWDFTSTIKKNPMVVFSIMLSIATFLFHVFKAVSLFKSSHKAVEH